MVNGYGMFDLVQPPYNLEVLASLFEENSIHHASVLARTMNTVALGYQWVDTTKTKKRIEKASNKEGDSLSRIRDELQREEDRLDELFENFNIDNCIRDAHIFCLLPKNINKKDCEIYLKIIKNSYDNLIKYPNKFNKLKTKNNNIKNYSIIISIINYCLMNYKPSYIVNPISIKLSEPIKFINLYTKNNYVFVNIKSISV